MTCPDLRPVTPGFLERATHAKPLGRTQSRGICFLKVPSFDWCSRETKRKNRQAGLQTKQILRHMDTGSQRNRTCGLHIGDGTRTKAASPCCRGWGCLNAKGNNAFRGTSGLPPPVDFVWYPWLAKCSCVKVGPRLEKKCTIQSSLKLVKPLFFEDPFLGPVDLGK